MTARIRHLTVILDHDIREDDLEATVAALFQLKGVASVHKHIVDARDAIARAVVRTELRTAVLAAVTSAFDEESE